MADTKEDKAEARPKARSPQYPVIGLGEAIEKARAIYAKDYQNRVPRIVVAKHMGFNSLNGKSLGVLATLSKYGLTEGRGDDCRISDRALAIIAHPLGDPERVSAVQAAANAPEVFQKLDSRFADGKGSDEGLRAYLIMSKFLPDAADIVIRAYRETKKVVGDESGRYDSSVLKPEEARALEEKRQKSIAPKVGDYVQWTSDGVDQFASPQRVVWLSEDGTHVRVHGSNTGIPVSEITLAEPPKAAVARASTAPASGGPIDGELSVLLRGNRLEITADVDRAGIARLRDVLAKYDEILALLGDPGKA